VCGQPRLSFLIHATVATGLLLGHFAVATGGLKQGHPDWYRAGLTTLLSVAIVNYLAAVFHLVRWLR